MKRPRHHHVLAEPAPPLRIVYTEGMGWRIVRGKALVATGFDTREEAQAHLESLT